jgi:hypothetical protein
LNEEEKLKNDKLKKMIGMIETMKISIQLAGISSKIIDKITKIVCNQIS